MPSGGRPRRCGARGSSLPGKAMASVTIDVDLPPGVTITAYERHGDGHGFEVDWPLPERCRCDGCGREDKARLEFRDTPQVVRDLGVWGQPSLWVYRPWY